MTDLYTGPVVFVDGVHYPATEDDKGYDKKRPLRWTTDGYRDAEKGEPLHNDVNHENDLELAPGSED